MKKQRIAAIVVFVLLCATGYALLRTRQAPPSLLPNTSLAAEEEIVDQRPLQTAQQFAKMPTSAEEKPFAEEALKLGDHEMDLAFAAAVNDAQAHPPVLSAKAKEIQARLQKAEDALDAAKKHVDELTAADSKASGSK
jgi:hypothetical protein